mmetsp:Transcript_41202/g.122237  ORF Transcript_41202/g.122237 Transcript_41202/m.122237 type:complete len:398 (+) Transcript_41202:2129-3322(+)
MDTLQRREALPAVRGRADPLEVHAVLRDGARLVHDHDVDLAGDRDPLWGEALHLAVLVHARGGDALAEGQGDGHVRVQGLGEDAEPGEDGDDPMPLVLDHADAEEDADVEEHEGVHRQHLVGEPELDRRGEEHHADERALRGAGPGGEGDAEGLPVRRAGALDDLRAREDAVLLVLLGVQVPLERGVHLEALHRHGLAGEHALVHHGAALHDQHVAAHDTFVDQQHVAGEHLAGAHLAPDALALDLDLDLRPGEFLDLELVRADDQEALGDAGEHHEDEPDGGDVPGRVEHVHPDAGELEAVDGAEELDREAAEDARHLHVDHVLAHERAVAQPRRGEPAGLDARRRAARGEARLHALGQEAPVGRGPDIADARVLEVARALVTGRLHVEEDAVSGV